MYTVVFQEVKTIGVITSVWFNKMLHIEKVIDRPAQTPLCGFTFATQKPLIKASL